MQSRSVVFQWYPPWIASLDFLLTFIPANVDPSTTSSSRRQRYIRTAGTTGRDPPDSKSRILEGLVSVACHRFNTPRVDLNFSPMSLLSLRRSMFTTVIKRSRSNPTKPWEHGYRNFYLYTGLDATSLDNAEDEVRDYWKAQVEQMKFIWLGILVSYVLSLVGCLKFTCVRI